MTKFPSSKDNIDALLDTLDAEGRLPNGDEKKALRGYLSGFGPSKLLKADTLARRRRIIELLGTRQTKWQIRQYDKDGYADRPDVVHEIVDVEEFNHLLAEKGLPMTKFPSSKDNIDALLDTLETEGRLPNGNEKKALRGYLSGFGPSKLLKADTLDRRRRIIELLGTRQTKWQIRQYDKDGYADRPNVVHEIVDVEEFNHLLAEKGLPMTRYWGLAFNHPFEDFLDMGPVELLAFASSLYNTDPGKITLDLRPGVSYDFVFCLTHLSASLNSAKG